MPNTTATQLKLRYIVGTDGTKDIIRAKSFSRLVPGISDVDIKEMAQKVTTLSEFAANAQRIDTKDIV